MPRPSLMAIDGLQNQNQGRLYGSFLTVRAAESGDEFLAVPVPATAPTVPTLAVCNRAEEEPVTAAEVTRALAGYEQRLRDLGVPVADRLRPGLGREEVDRLAAEFAVVLSEDAVAWWTWHDGDRLRYEDDWGTPSLTPTGVFCGLRAALERSLQTHETTWDQDADPTRPDLDWRFHRQWIALTQGTTSLIIDCRDPEAVDSPTGLWAADGGLGRTITLAERIGWWHWALDHRHWVPRPDGTWLVDDTRSPGALVGLHARDNAG